MNILLNEMEARVLGALLEKEITTPDYYPLSLNSLVNACNQKSNRDPVMNVDEDSVRDACVHHRTILWLARSAPWTAASPSMNTVYRKPSTSIAGKQPCSASCCFAAHKQRATADARRANACIRRFERSAVGSAATDEPRATARQGTRQAARHEGIPLYPFIVRRCEADQLNGWAGSSCGAGRGKNGWVFSHVLGNGRTSKGCRGSKAAIRGFPKAVRVGIEINQKTSRVSRPPDF